MRGMCRGLWLGLLSAVGLIGCGEPRTYMIASHKVPCHGVGAMLCLTAHDLDSGDQVLFYEDISGFSFQWGVTQTIDVQVHQVANPPQDASSKRYVLERVVERTPVAEGARFQMIVPGDLIWPDQGEGLSLASTRFTCATDALCEELARMAGDPAQSLTVEFSYPSSSDEPLVAERIVSAP
jgi:hypothetical protein